MDGLHYASIGGAVLFGSIVPVVPTGPILSAGAAVAVASDASWWLLVLIAAVAAGCGDLVVYQLGRRGPQRLRTWLTRRGEEQGSLVVRMATDGQRVLVVSRLLPAARIPALGAAGLIDYPMRRLVPAVAVGAFAWSLLYCLIGLVGGSIFEEHIWLAALVAGGLVLLVDAGARSFARVLRRRAARSG